MRRDEVRSTFRVERSTPARAMCGHCARPVGAVSMLGADKTRYHTGCWEAAIVASDRGSALKAAGGR